MEFRIEKDTMGKVQVPTHVYWGAQTQRSIENFNIARDTNRMPIEIIRAFAFLKKAAARKKDKPLDVSDEQYALLQSKYYELRKQFETLDWNDEESALAFVVVELQFRLRKGYTENGLVLISRILQ